jgi:subtilisin family serine protease
MNSKPLVVALIASTLAIAFMGEGVDARPLGAGTDRDTAKVTAHWHAGLSKERLHLILRDGSDVRLRGGRFVSPSGRDDVAGLNAALAAVPGAKIGRLYSVPEEELEAGRRKAQRNSGKQLADLNLAFEIRLRAGTDVDALVDALGRQSLVAAAYPEPLPVTPPVTPDFSVYQTYRNAAPDGINVAAARRFAGGTGGRVKIIDIENGWNTNHEDLARARGGFIANGTPSLAHADHGTAVLGQLIASDNGLGVTGLIPDAAVGMINAYTTTGLRLQDALYLAVRNLQPGDVILIEQHYPGARWTGDQKSQFGFLPAEYWTAFYDAIRYATASGIIVVEAAGNGSQNLDDPFYGSLPFPFGKADSGAILVGAGEAPNCGTGTPRSRKNFSNYSSRVDVQAWGECVMTTGYGDAYNGGPNATYTWFSGTSSASPIVAAAAGILSSIIETRTGAPANPSDIRARLKRTGTPQATGAGTLAGNIGSQPNLARALDELGAVTAGPVVTAVGQVTAAGRQVTAAGAVPTIISWSATDPTGISRYAVKMSTNGGAWTDVVLPSATATKVRLNLSSARTYQFTVAARNTAGAWSAWKSGVRFQPVLLSETDSSIEYSTGWTRPAWSPALGGYVKVSGTTEAWTSLRFTGRGVAWIGSMSTNRGKAKVWLDQTFLGTFDLYRDTTAARMAIVSRVVDPSVEHRLTVQVVGTAGRPKVDIDGFVVMR